MDLLYSIGNSTQYFVIIYMEKEFDKKNKYITESLWYIPETNTTL